MVTECIKGKCYVNNEYGDFMIAESDVSIQRYILYRWSNTKGDYEMLGSFIHNNASFDADVMCYLSDNIIGSKLLEWGNETQLNKTNETDMSEHQIDDYEFPEDYTDERETSDTTQHNETNLDKSVELSSVVNSNDCESVYNVLISKMYKGYGYSIIRVVSFTTEQKALDYINSLIDAWKIIGISVEKEYDIWKVKNDVEYKIEVRKSKVY